jgi:hypothetical protein
MRKNICGQKNNQESEVDRYMKKNSHIYIFVHKYGVKTLP